MSELFERAVEIANEKFDGHLTVMKFTGNWRAAFDTWSDRFEISAMPKGETLDDALMNLMISFEAHQADPARWTKWFELQAEMEEQKFECRHDENSK